jgi:hypothetical protein
MGKIRSTPIPFAMRTVIVEFRPARVANNCSLICLNSLLFASLINTFTQTKSPFLKQVSLFLNNLIQYFLQEEIISFRYFI